MVHSARASILFCIAAGGSYVDARGGGGHGGGGKCKKALYLHGSYSVRECDHCRGGFKRRHLRSQRRQDVRFFSNHGWWAWLRIAANQVGLGVDDMAFNTANFDAHLAGVLQPIGEGAISNMPTAAGAGWANLV